MLTHVFANAWFIIHIFVHNTVISLNLDEGHNIDELIEGETIIWNTWLMICLSKSNIQLEMLRYLPFRKGMWIFQNLWLHEDIYGVTVLFIYIILLFEIEMVGKISESSDLYSINTSKPEYWTKRH